MQHSSQRTVTGRKRPWLLLAVCYLVLLAVSHAVRLSQPDPLPASIGMHSMVLSEVGGQGNVTVRYTDTQPDASPPVPVILLIHGSPAPASMVFPDFTRELRTAGRVIVPDLPGFGYSSRHIANYGFDAHAGYLQALLERLGLMRVHLVAYSMGGGAALHMVANQPERFVSLTLISSIGVQELELLGDYHLNHAVHGLQLAGLWSIQTLIPHMGWLDRFLINTNYARNFFDSDQRPLRNLLHTIDHPSLIVHGRADAFVPPSAAREHHRLLPQSKLEMVSGGHLVVFQRPAEIAGLITRFVQSVDAGQEPNRAMATDARREAARQAFGRMKLPPAAGMQLIIYCLLIALATLVSEDLACIGAGMAAARGIIGLGPAVTAAFAGILIGDLLLFAAGRLIGRPALQRRPIRWLVKAEDVERATQWFEAKGPGIIFASRFLPGSRLPVYFTAGTIAANLWSLLFYFIIACAIWTPALVVLAMWTGERLLTVYPHFHRYALWVAVGTMLGLWAAIRLMVSLGSYRGRRLLISRYQRLRHWQYWPVWLVNIPVAITIFWQGLKHRRMTLFTAANPGFTEGGISGQSKSSILEKLMPSGMVPPFVRLGRRWSSQRKAAVVCSFMARYHLGFPLICKSDMGSGAAGVQLVRSHAALDDYLAVADADTILQQYASGREYSVFYYRYPDAARGHILSITEKRPIAVIGDGRSTLERLILKDTHAVVRAPLYLKVHQHRLQEVPAANEQVQLMHGHARAQGALCFDASRLITKEMERGFDTISRHVAGFYFGCYEVRVSNLEAFKKGRGFTIIALNGVTSEATRIYDPANTLPGAWCMLMHQWTLAIEIGAANVKRGAQELSAMEWLGRVFFRRR